MTKSNTVPKVLHAHSTFAAGGKELRAVGLMNAFGDSIEHTVVSAEPDQLAARELIDQGVKANFPEEFPSLTGWPTPGRLVAIAQAMKPFDLVLTYNWGAMDAVLAHTVFAQALGLPPLVHHEDGFNEDEANGLKKRRNWTRRVALGRTHKLVVPSRVLEQIAHTVWMRPMGQIERIPNGIDTKAFGRKPDPNSLRLIKREGERWVGTLAGLRPVKRLPMLVEACAELPENWHLVILGDGPERDAIQIAADELEVSHRVHLLGAHSDPASLIGLFDIFALSSKSEQFPLSVVEAMAAGLPIAAPEVGDVREIVSEANRPFVCSAHDTADLARVIGELVANEALRHDLGEENRRKACAQFDAKAMIEAYRSLYWGAMGKA
ncbi:glycosyltransferase [uncultured Erythrobacter sp.]|uniref:glycosyltransferase n=1 Tax=uncultured Erythrobacter sp. TaxID=263913 RepID=UPI00262F0605|nr:glycosyltransferase [uncultured Erythrobacter sp.]